MRLTVGGKVIPFDSILVKDSFNQICCQMTVQCMTPFFGECSLEVGSSKLNFFANRVVARNGRSIVNCIPLIVHLANKNYPAFKGTATFKELLEHFNIEYSMYGDTPSQYWEIPALKLTKWFEFIRFKVNSGYAPCMTFNMYGHLHMVDLKSRFESESMGEVTAPQMEMNLSADWERNIPLSIKVNHDMITTSTQEDVTNSLNWGSAYTSWLTTNEKLAPIRVQEMRNKMGVFMYTAQSVKVQIQQVAPFLGATYTVGGLNAVVTAFELTPRNVMAVLSSPRLAY